MKRIPFRGNQEKGRKRKTRRKVRTCKKGDRKG